MGQTAVYKDLKKQIILLEHKPGSVLREKELMETFGVSRTPVREALMRLEMEGLVRIIPNVGTIVADVSFQQLKDVFEVRSYLIRLSGQLAAARITEEELEEIRKTIDDMKKAEDPKTLMRLDGELHRMINDATKNEVLIKILKMLHDQAVRIWTFSRPGATHWNELVSEFDEIVKALEKRDGQETAQLLEKHTKRFVEDVRSQLI
jgi:DNA-binding GntR family transcriptional regulator